MYKCSAAVCSKNDGEFKNERENSARSVNSAKKISRRGSTIAKHGNCGEKAGRSDGTLPRLRREVKNYFRGRSSALTSLDFNGDFWLDQFNEISNIRVNKGRTRANVRAAQGRVNFHERENCITTVRLVVFLTSRKFHRVECKGKFIF